MIAARKDAEGQLLTSDSAVTRFNIDEFICKCGSCDFTDMSVNLIDMLHRIRSRVGSPIIITSGIRCPDHNRAVGGATASRHVPKGGMGHAVDLMCPGFSAPMLYLIHRQYDMMSGTGLYTTNKSLHIDDRPALMEWVGKDAGMFYLRDKFAKLMEEDLWS